MSAMISESKVKKLPSNHIGSVSSTANLLFGPNSMMCQRKTAARSSNGSEETQVKNKDVGNLNLKKRYQKMLVDGEFADCEFHLPSDENINNKHVVIKAHKIILVYASDVFRAMFLGALPVQNPIIISDVAASIFRHLLMFAYSGDFDAENVHFTENLQLAIAANKYLMKDLQKICIDRACKTLVPIKVFAAERVAELLNEEKLSELSQKMITTSTPSALNSLSFLEVSKERVVALLETERLNIPSELALIDACVNWTKHNHGKSEYREAMRAFLPHLRLLSLHPEEFSANISSFDWLTDSEKLSVLVNITAQKYCNIITLPETFCKVKTKRSLKN